MEEENIQEEIEDAEIEEGDEEEEKEEKNLNASLDKEIKYWNNYFIEILFIYRINAHYVNLIKYKLVI